MKKEFLSIFLFIIPGVLLYTIFVVYAFGFSLSLSFFSWSGVGPKIFVGLQNYQKALVGTYSTEFFGALSHNVYFFVLVTILELGLGFLLALALATQLRGYRVFQTIVFIPNVVSLVMVGFIWGMLLHPQMGLINQFLRSVGLGDFAKPWLGDHKIALTVIILVNVWRNAGFYILVLLAAILNIPPEFFEAAYIDGATNLKITWHIVLPLVKPTFQILTILLFIWSFNTFDLIYALEGVQAGPFRSTDVLGTLFYRTAFGGLGSSCMDMGLGATVVTFIFAIVFPVSILYVYLLERRS